MKVIKIDKNAWAEGLERLQGSCRLIGPVKDGDFYHFKALRKGELPDFSMLNTRLSPKSIVYPQSEVMFEYSLDESREDCHVMKEAQREYSPQVVIGIRPCDAKAFLLVQRNFETPEYKDPYWIRSYETTTLVGLACNTPCSTCFCVDAGSGPFHEAGLDILLMDAGDYYYARVNTSKGKKILKDSGWPEEAETTDADVEIENLKQAAETRIIARMSTDKLKEKNVTDLFNAPFWEDFAFACINCGTCTYVCPTCWCFDVQDEVRDSASCTN